MRAIFLTLAMTLVFSGCARRNIGGREFPLTIKATNGGSSVAATAYAVPYDLYLPYDGKLKPNELPVKFAKYKRTEGKTPVTIFAPSYRHFIFAERSGDVVTATDPVVPGPTYTNIVIDFP